MYCVDNLPVPMLGDLIERLEARHPSRRVAVGIGAQLPGQAETFQEVKRALVAAGHTVTLVFLEATVDAVLLS